MEGSTVPAFEGEVLHEQALTLLGDGAQTVDLLGYQPYVEAMVEVLAQERLQTPFAVGVFGRWGTGKSTFMNLLRRRLSIEERREAEESGGFHTVLFQPWQFEEKEEVWKALLLSVIRYLEVVQARRATPGSRDAERIRRTLVELALNVGKLALTKTVQTMTSGAIDLEKVLDAYAKTARDNSQFINTFRDKFGDLKQEILTAEGGDTGRLFVFVDDLDRCTPENCIMVLEAIKLFFDLPECVFILGIDREVVQRGIEQKYQQNLGIHGQDYIDKLIQLPFSLPPIRHETFERFVRTITGDFQFGEEIQALIVRAAEGNPRLAKRLSNCLQLTRTVARRLYDGAGGSLLTQIGTLDEAKLALLLTLQVRYPVAYLWLTHHPMTLETLSESWWERSAGGSERMGPDEGYRSRLIQFLLHAYGDRVAEQTADGFYALWRYAQNQPIAVSPFADVDQLQAYMRVTGIVDEDRASDAVKRQPPTAKETLDRAFLGPEDGENGSGGSGGSAATSGGDDESAGGNADESRTIVQQRGDQLQQQARLVIADWERFSNWDVLAAPVILPRFLSSADRLVLAAERISRRIDDVMGAEPRPSVETMMALDDRRDELREIRSDTAFRHVASVSLTFAFAWPIAMALLGTAARFVLEFLRPPEDAAGTSALASLIDRLSMPEADELLRYPTTAWDILLFPTMVFPGGPLFFWAAVLYPIFAVVVWRRARARLRPQAPPPGEGDADKGS